MPSTPEEAFRRLLDLILAKNTDAVADLWAQDGTVEFPFAAGSSPCRLAGREEVRSYLSALPGLVDMREMSSVTVHHTERPETIVVEFTGKGHTVRTGEPYRLDYIAVITIQDGLITRYRDYWSPLAVAEAAGTLPELLDALRSKAAG
ncbi:nuclear transport factor 2 family protein [Streptomyces sp. MspMP-M5]|uniref:nuclear transport factor 2 family protein n=1 Tax=unclassified Streptomyces TaxID=2593676 RepID=UPI00039D93F3|nr:nuclear transport factor 2 family protein [Streptomyces sp. MspMP-M5]